MEHTGIAPATFFLRTSDIHVAIAGNKGSIIDMGKRLVDRDDDTIVERHSTVLSRYISFDLSDLSQYRGM